MHILFTCRVIVAFTLLEIAVAAQTPSHQSPACGTTLSTFLTMIAGQNDPPDQRERFEFRECPGRGLQLWAFERGHATPTLASDLFDLPVAVFQSLNVIAFQSPGGSSGQVYIYAFENGHPRLIAHTATKGQMHVRRTDDGVAVIQIPATDYQTAPASASARMRRYVVPIDTRPPNSRNGR